MASDSPHSMIEGRSWKGWLIALFVVSIGAVNLRMARDDARRERQMRLSVQPISKEMAKTLSEATIADGLYRSHFFRFSLPIPEGWSFLTQEQIEEVERQGAELIETTAESAPVLRPMDTYAQTIFIARSNGALSKVASAITVVAEVVRPGMTIDDYIAHMVVVLGKAGENVVKVGETSDVEFRGRKFKVLKCQQVTMDGPTSFYVTIERDYVLSITMVASNPETAQQLEGVISAIEFTNTP